MTLTNKNRVLAIILTPFIACTGSASAGSDGADKYMLTNEKYNCNAVELESYISNVSTSLYLPVVVTSADEHIKNTLVIEKLDGTEACTIAFSDPGLYEKLQKLIKKVNDFPMTVPSNLLEPLMEGLRKQMDKLIGGVCGLLTKEFAEEKAKQFLEKKAKDYAKSKFGLSSTDLEALGSKEGRKDMLKDMGKKELKGEMKEKGVDARWIEKDGWKEVGKDKARKEAKSARKDLFK